MATVEIDERYRGAIEDLEGFDYVWLICWLDRPRDPVDVPERVTPMFRSDGSSVSLFATRCPLRGSPIGVTLVQLEDVDVESGRMVVRGVDLADGTPVLDLKPYVPAFDRPPPGLPVTAGWYDEDRLEAPLPNDAARSEALETATSWLAGGVPFVVVQLLDTPNVGAAPGGEFCVATPEYVAGDLLRGALDRELVGFIAGALHHETSVVGEVRADVTLAARRGIGLGQHQRVVAHAGTAIPPQWWDAMREGRPVALAIALDARPEPTVVLGDEVVGALGSDPRVLAEARRLLVDRVEGRSLLTVGTTQVALESFLPSPQLLLVGWPGLARVIAELARGLGWRTVAAPDADRGVRILETLSPRDAVVVLGHGRALDEPVLEAALREDGPGYVAAIGSGTVAANRRTRLGRLGVDPAQVQRLKSPAGLPLGGKTAAEIALSIVAELQLTRYGTP
jgi:xanthine/CO dehydrogenase XdhC/CoxF family maturation factor/tRNA (Thr-GGU) A37 N-methylase